MKITLFRMATWLAVASSTHAADVATVIELPWRYVIGAHTDGKWLNSAEAGKKLKKDTPFKLYTLKGAQGQVVASKASPDEDVCPDVWLAELGNKDFDSESIGIAAPWNAMPRAVKTADTKQEVYVKAVTDILLEQGIKKPVVKITQHLRMDLEGDGEEEVLLAATYYPSAEGEGNAPTAAAAGNYSFVALRRMLDGKLVTQILDGEFYPKSMEFNAPNVHRVGGVLDLDGDGKMEIILHSQYYEGGATTAWKVGAKKAVKVMEVGCGV